MSENKQHNKHKALRIFLTVLVVFVGLQLLGRYLLTTNWVHQIAKNKIESIANEQLNGTLFIGDLEGDLWTEVRLTNLSVVDRDTIFSADTIYANYNIWSFLRGPYTINTIDLTGIQSQIKERQDTVFNIQQLVKDSPDSVEASEPLELIISSINLQDINARVYSPSYLPDSLVSIQNLNANASFSKTDTLAFSLSSLSFWLEEGRLPEPIKVNTSANILEDQITLQELVIESSRSILKTSASANISDSTFEAEASTNPFSLADIQPYLDADIPEEEIDLQFFASGSLDSLKIRLLIDHEYAPNMELVAGVGFTGEPSLYQFGVNGDGIDITAFTNDSIDAEFGEFRIAANGLITPEIEEAFVVWGFTFTELRFQNYYLNKVNGSGTLNDDNLIGHVGVHPQVDQQLEVYPSIYKLSSETPEWHFNALFRNLDISNWVELGVSTDLSFGISLEGEGFELSDKLWTYSLTNSFETFVKSLNQNERSRIRLNRFSKNSVNDQEFGEYLLIGEVNKNILTGKGHITLEENRVDFEFDALEYLDIPQYNYLVSTKGFNLEEINQLSDFPTYLTMTLEGEGRGTDPEECTITTSVRVDSSIINGARFQKLDASATFSDGVLSITEGLLNSDIIEGEFTGRKNVMDETDPENWLSLDMRVKDIQPLAPLANLEVLNARGDVSGRITQDTTGVLKGNMSIDFQNIIVDSLITASRISGSTNVSMQEFRTFDLNLEIESPVISGIIFQDIELVSNGIANQDTLNANFNLDIVGSDRGKLIQDGSLVMDISEELIDVRFDQFDFITPESELSMTRPFNIRLKGQSIGTDTLDLSSTTGAFLKFSVPYADSVEQYGWMNGQNFDFGIIQEVIFGERFLDGVLSGELFFNRSEEQTSGNGAFNLTRLKYGDTEADSLDLRFEIFNERLKGNGLLSWDNEERVIGSLDIPFILEDQSKLDDEFYDKPVEGSLRINPSELTRFKALLNDFGVSNTDGILSFNGSMSGTAGEPSFEGRFILNEPVLSGIRVDTVNASFKYDNNQSGLIIESEIIAANQKAAQVSINYPVEYDFRRFEVVLPEGEEIIQVTAKTENFNIAVFNDFLDKEYLMGLTGILNADLKLEGVSESLVPSGYLRLTGAKVSVPKAGITLEGVKSDVEFTEAGLRVKEFVARSGRGSFNANGTISLEGIIPNTINLTAKASQFRLANTEDYNLVIDLDSRLTGKALTPKATGKLTVRNGFVYLQDFGENNVEEVTLDGEEPASFSPYDSLAMDMEIEIERNFYVRNRTYLDMEIELIGELDAQKETNGDLSLFGSLNGVDGYVRPLGKLFIMEEANFTFSGPIEDPDLNIKSRYTPPTRQKGEPVVLYYIIQGTAQDPDFKFESDPYMDEGDIICYALFNGPCTESWQSVLASGGGTSATDVLADVLLDEVEALATQRLGVDVVQIDNSGASGGTAIKTGWYLNQRTFFAIINEISGSSPKTLFMLEYILSEKWDLIMTQGDDNRRGIDFRFQHDY
ncbi:MAG: translocation/assembly module TamB [Balneolaceae bacterium]|nr:translocation/assembly module TamB [Balneolaceae bacterium]MBO6545860.1 translocation/assembly module TamB [Balneolaceae bacterium]MBO6647256.1 translocation/assembly module TamB [Balneolaceae bacterium]